MLVDIIADLNGDTKAQQTHIIDEYEPDDQLAHERSDV